MGQMHLPNAVHAGGPIEHCFHRLRIMKIKLGRMYYNVYVHNDSENAPALSDFHLLSTVVGFSTGAATASNALLAGVSDLEHAVNFSSPARY